MASVGRLADGLQLFLTGGATNTDPDASLGGVASSSRFRGLGAIVSFPLPAVRIDNVLPACSKGDATISVDANGNLVFTPPGGTAGPAVVVAAGGSAVLTGADPNQGIRVYRESGLQMIVGKSMTVKLVNILNGALGQKNVTQAQRIAGVTTYRALMLKVPGAAGVADIRFWFPPVAGLQATYSVATEVLVSGAIQTVANELTAPTGVSWVTPSTEGGALAIATIAAGASLGLWLRRVFPPAGIVNPQENVQLAMKFRAS